MASNQVYIEKADMAIADLTTGGLLAPEQAKQFMSIAIEESTLLSMVTVKPMVSSTYEISKLGFTSRVLRKQTEGAGLPVGDRSKPELGKVTLAAKGLIGEVRIPYSVVEDNIQNGSFNSYVIQELGKAVSRDLEELVIEGDTASADPFLSTFDGILKQATTRVYNAAGARLSKSVLKIVMQTMPSQFMKNKNGMAFITSKNAALDYEDSLASRATPVGDKALVDQAISSYVGMPVISIPKFPEDLGVGTNMTNLLFLDPKNIHVGMHREIMIETDKDISAQQYIIVVSLRADVKYAHEPAIVKATNILATAG